MEYKKFKTNSEKLNQIDQIQYNTKLPIFIRTIYNLILYNKLNNILCEEDKFKMDKLIWEDRFGIGINRGVAQTILEIQTYLSLEKHMKECQIDAEEMRRKHAKMYQESKGKEDEFNEDNYMQGLTEEELRIRNEPYPGGIYRIPDELVYQQRAIENGIDGDVSWIMFNKIYGCWFGIVTSPHRIRPDGKKGCVLFRSINWDDFKSQLRINMIKEKNLQKEFMGKRNRQPDINRVREVMEINNTDPNLDSDDIF